MKIPKEISLEREKVVWDLRQKSWTQDRIASHLNISQPAVAKILCRLSKRYKSTLLQEIEQLKTEHVAQLSHIADEAIQAWEKSKKPIKFAREKKLMGRDGKPIKHAGEVTNEAREHVGDARYLTVAMKAKEDIRKIIGADAPQKIQHSGDNNSDPISLNTSTAKARFLDKLSGLASGGGTDSNS